jgi:hypothetical protein
MIVPSPRREWRMANGEWRKSVRSRFSRFLLKRANEQANHFSYCFARLQRLFDIHVPRHADTLG